MEATNILKWLQEWYLSQCDDDWEHDYGIKIDTLDNPGWILKIDLTGTSLEGIEIQGELFQKSDDEWYSYKIEDNVYEAAGDPQKLQFLLDKFKEIAEEYRNDTMIHENS